VLFALAGLMSGFAFGAFTHKRPTASVPPPPRGTVPITQQQSTPTATTATNEPPVILGIPQFTPLPNTLQIADGQTPYTVTIQVLDKKRQPLQRPNITCKLWLVQRIPDGQKLNLTGKKDIASIQGPIPGQVQNQPYNEVPGLTFNQNTPQVQSCNAQGQATWNYTVAPTIAQGDYDLVILTDWKGIHYNWSWVNVTIKKPGA
jgi:hypothetical protein